MERQEKESDELKQRKSEVCVLYSTSPTCADDG